MREPFEDCPRYLHCNINKCPLDSKWHEKSRLADERRCPMEKGVRMRLGKKLKNRGLFPAEMAGHRNWEKMSKEKRAKFEARRVLYQFPTAVKSGSLKS